MDAEKILRGWKRCEKCNMSIIASPESREAYLECEYTLGLYCAKHKLIYETLELIKEQQKQIKNYKKILNNLKAMLEEQDEDG